MTLPFYRRAIAGAGSEGELKAFDDAGAAGDFAGQLAAISDRMLDEFLAVGDEKKIADKIAEYRDAGVTMPGIGIFNAGEGYAGHDATLEAADGKCRRRRRLQASRGDAAEAGRGRPTREAGGCGSGRSERGGLAVASHDTREPPDERSAANATRQRPAAVGRPRDPELTTTRVRLATRVEHACRPRVRSLISETRPPESPLRSRHLPPDAVAARLWSKDQASSCGKGDAPLVAVSGAAST